MRACCECQVIYFFVRRVRPYTRRDRGNSFTTAQYEYSAHHRSILERYRAARGTTHSKHAAREERANIQSAIESQQEEAKESRHTALFPCSWQPWQPWPSSEEFQLRTTRRSHLRLYASAHDQPLLLRHSR